MMHSIMIQEGHDAYYDEVPRYKCSYTADDCVEWWNYGWDQAQKEHALFTENQTLKAKNEVLEKSELMGLESLKISVDIIASNAETIESLERDRAGCMEENMFLVDDVARLKEQLEVQKMELEGDIEFAGEQVERFKEDAKNFASAFKYQCKDMDKLQASTVEISTELDTAFYYSTDSNIFSFRRESLIDYLKKLRVKIKALKESFPEKTTKSKKDA